MDELIKDKKRNLYYGISLLIGCLSGAWGIFIYEKTFFSLKYSLSAVLLFSLIATIEDFRKFAETYDVSGKTLYFLAYMQNLIGWGLLLWSTIVLLNFYFPQDLPPVTRKFRILEKRTLSGNNGRRPLVLVIRRFDREKDLHFPSKYTPYAEEYKFVEADIQRGLFGWEIITYAEPVVK